MTEGPFERVRREAAGTADRAANPQQRSKGRRITPVPADAPPTPSHAKLGKPAASWAYRDEAGRLLGHVLRFEGPDGKEIRPLTWREGERGPSWTWEAFDDPRPLYGLDRLAARPGAPVLIVEGEKAADAAAESFPDFVALTWPGGAKAVGKADFRPLKGRAVIVWPDADEEGRRAATAAVRAAEAAGAAHVAAVDLPPDLPAKWDLADPWPAGFGQAEAVATIHAARSARRRAPAPRRGPQEPTPDPSGATWPAGFRMDPNVGLCCTFTDNRGPREEWVPDPFEVLGEARDANGRAWSVVVRVRARDGRPSVLVLPRASLANGGNEARSLLSDAGLTFATGQGLKEKLTVALMRVHAGRFIELTDVTGWHRGRFVLPDRTVGPTGGEDVLFTGEAGALKYAVSGDLRSWQERVAKRAIGNPLLMFALSCGFAAPLLRLLEAEGGGFHFRGNSSSGKSTLLVAAGSIWGGDLNAGQLGFSHTWRATANALETLAQAHNDTLLCLDEFAQVDPRDAGGAAYMLANGEAKKRLRSDGRPRPDAKWLLLFLSSGEVGLADHVAADGKGARVAAGQELRLIDVSADAGHGSGIWQTVADGETAAQRSEALKAAAKAHFGHAGPAFLAALTMRYWKREESPGDSVS